MDGCARRVETRLCPVTPACAGDGSCCFAIGIFPWSNATSPKNSHTVGSTGIASTQVDGNGQAWVSTHASKTRQLTIPHRHNEPDSCDDCIVSIHIRLIRTAVPELYHIPHTQSPSQPIPCHKATDTDYYVRLFTNFTTGGRSP